MIELKAYRHKTMKDLFLVRTSICGGNENTKFYEVTENVIDAIISYNRNSTDGHSFMSWFRSFPNNKVTVTLTKEMELDGYKGALKKTVEIPVSEFELITFAEVEDEEH